MVFTRSDARAARYAPAMIEEKEFVLRFALSAEFGDAEDADDDGYAWARRWEEQVKPSVVRAVFAELRGQPWFTARVRNRGASAEREIEIALELVRPAAARGGDA